MTQDEFIKDTMTYGYTYEEAKAILREHLAEMGF